MAELGRDGEEENWAIGELERRKTLAPTDAVR